MQIMGKFGIHSVGFSLMPFLLIYAHLNCQGMLNWQRKMLLNPVLLPGCQGMPTGGMLSKNGWSTESLKHPECRIVHQIRRHSRPQANGCKSYALYQTAGNECFGNTDEGSDKSWILCLLLYLICSCILACYGLHGFGFCRCWMWT